MKTPYSIINRAIFGGAFVFNLMIHLYTQESIAANNEIEENPETVLREVIKPNDIDEESWDRVLYIYKRLMEQNEPIEFYGVITDPNDNKVSGAIVSGYVLASNASYLRGLSTSGHEQKQIKWSAITDSSGRFIVNNIKGYSLSVKNVEKDGFISPPFEESYLLSKNKYGNDVYKQNADAPVTFTIWPANMTSVVSTLIKKELIITGRSDNASTYVDLVKGVKLSTNTTAADLVIGVNAPASLTNTNPQLKYDWSFFVKAPNGGVFETQTVHPYLAPTNGYLEADTYYFRGSDPGWNGSARKVIFVQSRNEKVYAAVILTVYAYDDGHQLIRIQSVANTNGSPNLMTLRR